MFRWFWRREQKRLYAMTTPYSTMFNIEPSEAGLYLARFKRDCPTIPASLRPMTDDEMRKYD